MSNVIISCMAGHNIIFMDIILEIYKTRIWQIDPLPLKRLQCSESLASNEPVAALTQQLLVPVLLVLLPVPLPVLLLLLLMLPLPELALVLLPVPVLPLPVPKINLYFEVHKLCILHELRNLRTRRLSVEFIIYIVAIWWWWERQKGYIGRWPPLGFGLCVSNSSLTQKTNQVV